MLDALLPASLPRCARRLSTILILLGVLALFLFPASARAGTEVQTDRWITGGLLVLAGALVRVLPERTLPLLLLHGAAQAFLGGVWAAALSAAMLVYSAAAAWRARGALHEVATRASGGDDADAQTLHRADLVRENVEAVVMALLIALTVREFLYEAFVIPTASMEPTIYGRAPGQGRAHGDHLLATKVPLLFGDPPRWSIVVFKYPLYRPINYIKRLVGLPGEHLEIRRGDIYVNGEVVAKPEEVQNQLWFREFPSETGNAAVETYWKAADGNATWALDTSSATVDVPAGSVSRLRYDQTLDREDTDLRVGAQIDVASIDDSDGAVLLRVDAGGRVVDLEIGPRGAWLTAPGTGRTELAGVRLPPGGARVDLGVADRVARVSIDGRLVARERHADASQSSASDSPRVSIGVRSASVRLTDLRVDHDLQYSHGISGRPPSWDIPSDGFIMLGDNTLRSKDSREWDVVELTTVDGRVYRGENSVKLEDDSQVAFHQEGDDYVFIDVDGILRHVPTAGTQIRKEVAAPFVRREDLVGRAFVTFYPFPPFGDFRPHFLP